MLLVSWNVNGLRACMNKGFREFFDSCGADIICLQETKAREGQACLDIPEYAQFFNSSEKSGYSGTAIFTKPRPVNSAYDFSLMDGAPEEDSCFSKEGRMITLEYKDFWLVNVYAPNSRSELARLDIRMKWEDAFRSYISFLDSKKPVVICGDLNVAHNEIDIKNAKSNRMNAGFTDQERAKFTELLSSGLADTFRRLYPDRVSYTWWSYMFSARAKNVGWRLDYFLVSERLMPRVEDSLIYTDIMGSDHCPVGIKLAARQGMTVEGQATGKVCRFVTRV
jgi:exodeoxyribonuclease-3